MRASSAVSSSILNVYVRTGSMKSVVETSMETQSGIWPMVTLNIKASCSSVAGEKRIDGGKGGCKGRRLSERAGTE